MAKIITLSDTHNRHKDIIIPECDIIIHAGDFTGTGMESETRIFIDWFSKQPAKYKVLIEGNHDFYGEENPGLFKIMCEERGITLLNDSGCELEGLKFWGSPITPWFMDWAYNRFRGDQIANYWSIIPNDIDILITHGPPYNILDETPLGLNVGCEQLFKKVMEIKPLVHIFGHIHDKYGHKTLDDILFVNSSICDESYRPFNKPWIIEIENKKVISINEIN